MQVVWKQKYSYEEEGLGWVQLRQDSWREGPCQDAPERCGSFVIPKASPPCSEDTDQTTASSRKPWRRKAGGRNPSQSVQLHGLWSAVAFRESSALILALLTEFLYLPSWWMPALAIIILISLPNRNSSHRQSFLNKAVGLVGMYRATLLLCRAAELIPTP